MFLICSHKQIFFVLKLHRQTNKKRVKSIMKDIYSHIL